MNCFFNNEAPVYHRKKLPLQNEFNETTCFIVFKEMFTTICFIFPSENNSLRIKKLKTLIRR